MGECPICLDPIDPTSPRVGACRPCMHVFHGACLLSHMLHNKPDCPVCRTLITEYKGRGPTIGNFKRFQEPERYQHSVTNRISVTSIPRIGDEDYILCIRQVSPQVSPQASPRAPLQTPSEDGPETRASRGPRVSVRGCVVS